VLANVASRNDNLSVGYVVVGQKNNFDEVAGCMIVIDHFSYFIDQLNDSLSIDVTRSSFPTEHNYSRNDLFPFLGGHGFDGQISVDCVENVHKLALIFVDAFHLYIKEPIVGVIYFDVAVLLDPLTQPALVL
jgi:hypothetical protein